MHSAELQEFCVQRDKTEAEILFLVRWERLY